MKDAYKNLGKASERWFLILSSQATPSYAARYEIRICSILRRLDNRLEVLFFLSA
jgi:hypothetical protein